MKNMQTEYNTLYEWFEKRPYYTFPENLLTFEKFAEFDRSFKGDKSDKRAYNLALCYGADAYKELIEIKL